VPDVLTGTAGASRARHAGEWVTRFKDRLAFCDVPTSRRTKTPNDP
jgi:hypothetical protein